MTAKCSGIRVSGYWKGSPCGAIAKYELNGKNYCQSHWAIAVNNPERFDKVSAQIAKRKNE